MHKVDAYVYFDSYSGRINMVILCKVQKKME